MTVTMTRRRAITVVAAAVGLPLLAKAASARPQLTRWEGTTLGAPSTIQLYHHDERAAQAAIHAGLEELARQEAIFSVYRADSSLSALNRDGRLDNAPVELVELLGRALRLAELSGGVWDPTIQPLWQTYFRHFTAPGVIDPAGPSEADLRAAKALVDWRAVDLDGPGRRIAFARPGMGLTLNSGAQGYITDRVANVLRAHGFENMLVDMGEPRALSTKPDGQPWRIGIANPADQTRAITEIDVVDRCVATSGGYGTIFDDAGRFTHIINARTGISVPALEGVSVVAPTAMAADGLSTAMLLVPVDSRQALLKAAGGELAIYVTPDGVVSRVSA